MKNRYCDCFARTLAMTKSVTVLIYNSHIPNIDKPAPTQPTNPNILLTENNFMELHEDIAGFLYLLNQEPNTFLPTAWRDLADLNAEIAKLADDESSIAETIKDWCVERELGEELRDSHSRVRKDFDDAGEPTPTTQQMLTNTTQTLRQAIEEACEKLRQLDAQKLDKGNDSK